MKSTSLKTFRFIVPAAILYFYVVALCWFSHWCELAMPTSYDQFTKSILAIVLGYLYTVSCLRNLSNRDYHLEVNRNISERLYAPFVDDQNVPRGLAWRKIKNVFYFFVDRDESLRHRSLLAFSNGLLWTSAADLRAISALACASFALSMLAASLLGDANFDFARAIYVFLLALFLFLLSIPFSRRVTKKHLGIGSGQCDYIVLHSRNELREKLIEAGK